MSLCVLGDYYLYIYKIKKKNFLKNADQFPRTKFDNCLFSWNLKIFNILPDKVKIRAVVSIVYIY